MPSVWFTPQYQRLGRAQLNLETADIRAKMVMANTTCFADRDAATVSAITTVDEYNGGGYLEQTLGSKAVNLDLPNNRAEFTFGTINFGASVAAGARNAVGILLIDRVDGTAANDRPLAYIEFSAPFAGNGGPVTYTPNAEGAVQIGP